MFTVLKIKGTVEYMTTFVKDFSDDDTICGSSFQQKWCERQEYY